MKNYVLTLIGTLMLGNSIAVAQDYDDDPTDKIKNHVEKCYYRYVGFHILLVFFLLESFLFSRFFVVRTLIRAF